MNIGENITDSLEYYIRGLNSKIEYHASRNFENIDDYSDYDSWPNGGLEQMISEIDIKIFIS